MEVNLEGSSLVKFARYYNVISFQGGMPRPSRPVLNYQGLEVESQT